MEQQARRLRAMLLLGTVVSMFATIQAFAAPTGPNLTFTTLGTNSGPVPNPARSEPASLIRYQEQTILVDVGDGAIEQLAKAGVNLGQVQTVFISHLHFDHTGGLFAFLGCRYQARFDGPLTIYGPPGTKRTIDGIIEAMQPGLEVASTIRGPAAGPPDLKITVVELREGSKVQVGQVAVTAAENSHFATFHATGGANAPVPISLSYRFDTPGRSILYTGDTGPSQNVERLGRGVDLLVSEIMDPVATLNGLKAKRPDTPEAIWRTVDEHFRKEHLSPDEVGRLAERAGAKALVLTHDPIEPSDIPPAQRAIAAHFKGKITFAQDLQTF